MTHYEFGFYTTLKLAGVTKDKDPKKPSLLTDAMRRSGEWAEVMDDKLDKAEDIIEDKMEGKPSELYEKAEDTLEDKAEDAVGAGTAFIRSRMR